MIHSVLKQSTQALHDSIEGRLALLLSENISLNQYATILKRFYGFYKPIEAELLSIGGWDDPNFRLHDRLKLPLLTNDLASLLVAPVEIARLPACENLPCLKTVGEAMGCLYVLEGSTLGGRIIARHLKKVFRPEDAWDCLFFQSYGNDVARIWSDFLKALSRHNLTHGDQDAIVRSACQTFESLDVWLASAECVKNS